MLFSGKYITLPFFHGHDYALLPGEFTVNYYHHVPSCVKDFTYLVTIAQTQVSSVVILKRLIPF